MTEPKEFSEEFIAAVKAGEIPHWTSVDKVAAPAAALVDVKEGAAWELKHNYPTTQPGYVYGKPIPVNIQEIDSP